MLGPVFGLLTTAVVMFFVYQDLGIRSTVTPEELAQKISISLYGMLIGAISGLFGMIILLIVLYRLRNRRRWFFIVNIASSSVAIFLMFPVGLILALPVLISFLLKRREFFCAEE